MKKFLSIALILGATALMACPNQQGMMNCGNGPMGNKMAGKCQCDTSKLPKQFENLGLNDDQKGEIQKLREEAKAFHNEHHEKMMAVLTPEQRTKFEASLTKTCKKCNPKGAPLMPKNGMGCKACDTK
ncbi:MAG: hypothetical protein M0P91_13200 [Sulfuricurvum sp.]|jgi:Spy/CpxP family protein refolding chaperone|uniref:hypothetical protein n=1 Tax=Sulfuricurvum sp. TaxID=2025608 RepID=UPI0025FF4DF7|nr:hypothetical protein [Sulfuricurvum sp.]MCK9374136.1 hypothetical protein [Sulfuricurvum sp.]